jgi:hypothetical protein
METKTLTRNRKSIIAAVAAVVLALTMVFALPPIISNASDAANADVEIVNLNEDGAPVQGDVYKGSPTDDQIEVQVRQDGSEMSFSTDGGKTWSDTLPADAGMTLTVEEQ